jgi:MFS family permease
MFLYLTIYIQSVLDYSPLEAGLRFLPQTVLAFVVSPIAGKFSDRVPLRIMLGVGLGMCGVGLLLMYGLTVSSDWTALLAGFIVSGIGIGITNPGIGQGAIAVVPPEKAGMGSGINSTFRQVGIATGVAGLGAVFQSQINSKLAETLPRAPKGLGEAVSSGGTKIVESLGLPPAIQAEAVAASKAAFISGFNTILMIAAITAFVGAALGFLLVRKRDFVAEGGPQPGPESAAEPAAARN